MNIEEIKKDNDKFKADLLKAISQDIAKINERLDKLDKRYDLVDRNLDKLFDLYNNRKPKTIIHNNITTVAPRDRSFVEDMAIMVGFGDIFE